MSTEHEQVVGAVETMTRAFHEGDIEGVMASYEPAAAISFEPGQPVHDVAMQRRMFEESFALQPQFEYGEHTTVVVGEVAIHSAPWRMRAKAPDGTAIEQRGLSVAVLRRQSDGSWKLLIDDPHGSHVLERTVFD